MKKLMVAILVLAAAFVHAQKADVEFDVANHLFKVNSDGKMYIQFYEKETTFGNDAVFGYYQTSSDGQEMRYVLADKDNKTEYPNLKGSSKFTIKDLKNGDTVRFFVIPTTDSGEISAFEEGTGKEGQTTYGIAWDKGNSHENHNVTFYEGEGESTPSGQPLPGALTTMLVAGGCAALLRKRKAARK